MSRTIRACESTRPGPYDSCQHRALRLVRVVVVGIGAIGVAGCLTPHARYRHASRTTSRTAQTRTSYLVPRDWDYRTAYRLPESRLITIIDSYLGIPYRYGGTNRKGLDCSGFVYLVFRELNRARMPRSTRRLKRVGRIVPRREAKPGDLVFFWTSVPGRVNHVGICVGNGRFVHASSSKGVTYSDLDSKYFRRHFVFVRRIF